MGDSEYSALKEAIDTAMGKIKNAKNSIKSAINTAGASMHVHVDDTDTFRSYADAIRLMYQRIWSSDDGTDAPAKCIITNDDFPLAPMHNYGYIDINDLSADRFGDDKKYYAASSFIVDIQNPPVPILSEDNLLVGKVTSYYDSGEWIGVYDGQTPPDEYRSIVTARPFPHEPRSIQIGMYCAFCRVCYNSDGGASDRGYMSFPGGYYISFTLGNKDNTITILADGKQESFKYLGSWDHGTYGVWQRLNGGN